MTKIEKHLIETTEYLKSIGLTTFLIGSTLLQIVRTGEFKLRHQFDKEINVGCRDEDFTGEMLEKMKKDYALVKSYGSYILFGNHPDSFWGADFFSLLGKFVKEGNERVEYMGAGKALVWPAKHLNILKQIDYKGYKFNVPNYRFKWLEHYFGEHWREEDLKWAWPTAPNCREVK